MSTQPLFGPLQIGPSTLEHRVVMAPLTRMRATTRAGRCRRAVTKARGAYVRAVRDRVWPTVQAALLWALLAAASAGCGANADMDDPPADLRGERSAAPPASAAGVPPAADPSTPLQASGLQQIVQVVLADAARRTGLDAAALKVASAEPVTWADGSLGCPQPGMLYTQALVPGYRVRIEAGDAMLDYHAGLRGSPVLCPPERAREPVAGENRT